MVTTLYFFLTDGETSSRVCKMGLCENKIGKLNYFYY